MVGHALFNIQTLVENMATCVNMFRVYVEVDLILRSSVACTSCQCVCIKVTLSKTLLYRLTVLPRGCKASLFSLDTEMIAS